MEKIVTVLWKSDGQGKQEHADALLGRSARLIELGARKLTICVEDDDVDGDSLRMNPAPPPKSAMVSYWVECSEDRGPIEAVLSGVAADLAAFLVVESRPIVNTDRLAPLGERTPGMVQVTGIVRKAGLDADEFLRIWHEEQRPCAIETQSTFQYVRNEIVRQLSGPPQPWAAIVEEAFPIEAMSDPYVFFDAVGDEERFQANIGRMVDTVARMLEMDQTDVTITSEYVFER
ncbi:MAG: EthD domain-containing protein [Acidimicrobiales bacterium]|nr:EthD domain-containing protein [Acidimicrobiales bacterium]